MHLPLQLSVCQQVAILDVQILSGCVFEKQTRISVIMSWGGVEKGGLGVHAMVHRK